MDTNVNPEVNENLDDLTAIVGDRTTKEQIDSVISDMAEENLHRMMEEAEKKEQERKEQQEHQRDQTYNSLRLYELSSKFKAEALAATKYPTSIIPQPEMRKMIHDEMTVSRAADQLARHDFGALDIYISRLHELSFLEMYDLKQRVDAEILRLTQCKDAIECFRGMRGDRINREIMFANALNSCGYEGMSVEEFESGYEDLLAKLEDISAALVNLIDSGKDVVNHTASITNEMISLLKKKLAGLDPSDVNYAYDKKVIEKKIAAFQDRANYTWLKNHAEAFAASQYRKIQQMRKRDYAPALNAHKMPKCVKSLVSIFGEETIIKLWTIFVTSGMSNYEMYVWFVMLLKAIENGKNGNSVYPKLFILNIADYCSGVYDLACAEAFSDDIYAFLEDIDLDLRKIRHPVAEIYWSYGLNLPEGYTKIIDNLVIGDPYKGLVSLPQVLASAFAKATEPEKTDNPEST